MLIFVNFLRAFFNSALFRSFHWIFICCLALLFHFMFCMRLHQGINLIPKQDKLRNKKSMFSMFLFCISETCYSLNFYQQSQMFSCSLENLCVYFFFYLNNNRYFIVCSVYTKFNTFILWLHALINFSTIYMLNMEFLMELDGE